MKKLVPFALLALATTGIIFAQEQAQSPSLGDVARQQKSTSKANKVWTNDDFPDRPAPEPDATTPTDANGAPSTDATGAASTKDGKDAAKSADGKDKAASAEDQEKLDAEWKGKLDAQKAKIADLKREADLTDREYKLQATTFYADAGNRLRDQKDFHDKEQGYRDKLSALQQQITDEQAKLAELQEQAHKAGANKAYE